MAMTIRGDVLDDVRIGLAFLEPQSFLDCQTDGRAAGHVASGVHTDAHDLASGRDVVEHRVEFDDTMDVGQRNVQHLADCLKDFAR